MTDFKEIWLPLGDRFYRLAFYMLEQQADAQDAVQELYLKLWGSQDKLGAVKNPLAYGMTLLKNICIDKIRKRTKPQETEIPTEEPPDRQIIAKDTLQRLLKEIDLLPGQQAGLIKMRAIDGLEYSEISELTGLSQIHIRVLVSKARKTLKSKI